MSAGRPFVFSLRFRLAALAGSNPSVNAPIHLREASTGWTLPTPDGATPVMQQFFAAKAKQPDALVFFRMGDFYELFFDDARKAAEALGIALTFRGKHAGEDIPMCGVPIHAAEAYLAKLIRSGFKGRGLRADGEPGGGAKARLQVDRPPGPRAGGDAGHPDRGLAFSMRAAPTASPPWRCEAGRRRWRPSSFPPETWRACSWTAPPLGRRWRRFAPPRSWFPTACSPMPRPPPR